MGGVSVSSLALDGEATTYINSVSIISTARSACGSRKDLVSSSREECCVLFFLGRDITYALATA